MRVIAGSARHIPLETVPGDGTRPTTDRIKETLFNMIQFQIAGESFLDLFSGSGAIGIEALSRGAREAVFVDNDRRAADCIRRNLEATHLSEKAVLYPLDVITAIAQMKGHTPFSFVFMDPPYRAGMEESVLCALKQAALIDEYTVIIVEAKKETAFDFAEELGFHISKVKEYKTNKHVFFTFSKG